MGEVRCHRRAVRSRPTGYGWARRRSRRPRHPLGRFLPRRPEATETNRPPLPRRASERSSRSPPTVSKTRSTCPTTSSNCVGVVDHLIGPELARGLDALRRGGPDDEGATHMRELHRQAAHPTGRSVDEHPLAFAEPPVIEQPLPRAEPRQGQRCTLHVTQRPRLGGEHLPGTRTYSAAAPSRSNPLRAKTSWTGGQIVHAPPNLGHDPRELIRGRRREPVGGPVELIAGDSGGFDAHQHLALSRARGLDRS